jgi:hypothetical protein
LSVSHPEGFAMNRHVVRTAACLALLAFAAPAFAWPPRFARTAPAEPSPLRPGDYDRTPDHGWAPFPRSLDAGTRFYNGYLSPYYGPGSPHYGLPPITSSNPRPSFSGYGVPTTRPAGIR